MDKKYSGGRDLYDGYIIEDIIVKKAMNMSALPANRIFLHRTNDR